MSYNYLCCILLSRKNTLQKFKGVISFDPAKKIKKYPFDAWMFEEEFFNELLIIIKRKKTVQLVVDEGWHSEEELKQLGWSATLS